MSNLISCSRDEYDKLVVCLQMLAWYSYKNNYCIEIINALTKCLKFARVEVIQKTQKSPFHFLDI